MSHAQNDPVAVARGLTGALDAVRGELAELRKRMGAEEKRNHLFRILVIAAVIGFLADVTATTVAFIAIGSAHRAIASAQHNAATVADVHQSVVSACQGGNKVRAQQERALDAILTPAPQGAESSAQRAAAAAFLRRARADVARGWGPRDCTSLYKLRSR